MSYQTITIFFIMFLFIISFYFTNKTFKEMIQFQKDTEKKHNERIKNLKEVISGQFTVLTEQRQTVKHLMTLKTGSEELEHIAEWLMEYENSGRIDEEDTLKEIDKIISSYFKKEEESDVS